jgi:hypothetical protein
MASKSSFAQLQEEYLKLKTEYTELEKKYMTLTAEHEGQAVRLQGEINLRNQYKREHSEFSDALKNLPDTNDILLRVKELQEKLKRENAGRKRTSDISDSKIVELRNQGMTVKAIEEQTGVSTATINRILRKHK